MNKRLSLLGFSLLTAAHLYAIDNLLLTFKYGLSDLDGSLSVNKHTFGLDLTLDNARNFKPKFDFAYLFVDERNDGVDYTLQASANVLYESTEVYYGSWIPYLYGGVGYEYVHNARPKFDSAPYLQVAGGIEFPFFHATNDDYKLIAEARWMQMLAESGQESEAAIFVGFRISTGSFSGSGFRGDDYVSYGDELSTNYVEIEADEVKTNTPELTREHLVFSDTDGDGVADKDDRCPHTPQGVVVDEHGCAIGGSVPNRVSGHAVFGKPLQTRRQRTISFKPIPKKRVTFSINYAPNQVEIPRSERGKIRQLVERLNRRGYQFITVEGYTDNSGTPEHNLRISQKRAEAARKLMIQYGIDPAKITAVGKGELNPIANNDVPEGRALNRRIEIIIE